MRDIIAQQLRASAELKLRVAEELSDRIAVAASLLIEGFRAQGRLLLFGNGGSAADAQHIAAALTCRLRLERLALPAIALTCNSSVLTAQANDHGFATVFARQVEAIGRTGDLVLALSTSGASANVVEAVVTAKANGLRTICLTGVDGGRLWEIADLAIVVPSAEPTRIQEAHITIGHILCDLVENALFAPR